MEKGVMLEGKEGRAVSSASEPLHARAERFLREGGPGARPLPLSHLPRGGSGLESINPGGHF